MKNKLGLISVLLVAALLIFGCTSQQQPPQAQNNSSALQPAGNPGAGAPPSLVGTKFSDWKYYSMANQIAPGPISSSTQAALNIFSVQQTQQADGSILVMVTDNVEGKVSNFTVAKGEILYFSDGNPGDDVGNESDKTLIDDHFVLVDGNNTIVEMLSTP